MCTLPSGYFKFFMNSILKGIFTIHLKILDDHSIKTNKSVEFTLGHPEKSGTVGNGY